jgi:hypothetical protein
MNLECIGFADAQERRSWHKNNHKILKIYFGLQAPPATGSKASGLQNPYEK